MAEETVIKAGGVYLGHEDHLAYGPFDLELKPGQGALVLVDDLGLMRRLMRCCLGLDRPDAGRLAWWPGSGPDYERDWDLYSFYRRIGYVDRLSQLLGSLTLFENLALSYLYAGSGHGPAKTRRVLELFGLAGYEHLRGDDLPEPQRRLALYAQAFSQRPRLMLMERPAQFLDRDFDQVWGRFLKRAAGGGLAYLVFDRVAHHYAAEHFNYVQTFSPGRY